MVKTIDIRSTKPLAKLVAEVASGADITVTRAGKPVAKLTAIKTAKPSKAMPQLNRKSGFMKGQIKILKGFYDPLPEDILKAFWGEND